MRQSEWEKLFSRGKDQVMKERSALDEHLKIEHQIKRIDKQEIKKW